MLKTIKEIKQELKKIGSTNLEISDTCNIITGGRGKSIIDLDRNYYWNVAEVEDGKYKLTSSGSIL